jgi:hypothetical protein
MRRRFCRSISALAGLLAAGSLTLSCAAVAQEQVAAVYKAHEVRFVYRSFVNLYDCGELRNHVAAILLAVGARDDIKVRVDNCELFISPDETSPQWDRSNRYDWPTDRFGAWRGERMQTSNVRVALMFPIEATPEVLAEIDKDKSRRELVSRVTGNPLAALNDPVMFPAQRREVTLSRGTIRLGPEDCELLEQMVPTVFRKLDVTVTRRQLSCDLHQRSQFAPKLVVETLLPVGALAPGEKEKKK